MVAHDAWPYCRYFVADDVARSAVRPDRKAWVSQLGHAQLRRNDSQLVRGSPGTARARDPRETVAKEVAESRTAGREVEMRVGGVSRFKYPCCSGARFEDRASPKRPLLRVSDFLTHALLLSLIL